MSGMFLLIVLCRTGEGMTLLFLDCADSNGNHHQTANHAYSALMFQQNIRDEGKPPHMRKRCLLQRNQSRSKNLQMHLGSAPAVWIIYPRPRRVPRIQPRLPNLLINNSPAYSLPFTPLKTNNSYHSLPCDNTGFLRCPGYILWSIQLTQILRNYFY